MGKVEAMSEWTIGRPAVCSFSALKTYKNNLTVPSFVLSLVRICLVLQVIDSKDDE